jgi:hypothetical protein
VFFGDATTAFLSLNQQWPSNWINAGVVNPETTAQELARFPEVLSLHPNILHIIPGIGDISAIDYTNQDFVIPQIEANVTAMIAEAKRANIKVVLGTVAPIYVAFPSQQSNPISWLTLNGPEIMAMNAWIESYGAANNIPVVNYHDLLCGQRPVFTATSMYAYGCVGSTNVNQETYIDLPYLFQCENGSTYPSVAGNQAMIQMATTAIATINLTLKSGHLSDAYTAPLIPSPQQTNINTVPASAATAVQFIPIGVYSDGVARPILNTNFAGMNGTWTSSNLAVMYVSQDGTAIALAPGKARISFTSLNGVQFSPWDMTVRPGPQ